MFVTRYILFNQSFAQPFREIGVHALDGCGATGKVCRGFRFGALRFLARRLDFFDFFGFRFGIIVKPRNPAQNLGRNFMQYCDVARRKSFVNLRFRDLDCEDRKSVV